MAALGSVAEYVDGKHEHAAELFDDFDRLAEVGHPPPGGDAISARVSRT